MPISLSGSAVKDTFTQLLHVSDGPTATEKTVYGAGGVATALKVSTVSVGFGNLSVEDNTISATNTNGSIVLTPNGTGTVGIAKAAVTGGSVTGVSELTAIGPVGYETGAGGAATQATDKTTAVTVNAVCGQVTMNGAQLNRDTAVSFTLTNNKIAATDVVLVSIASAATAGAYSVTVDAVAAGSCRISLRNHLTGTDLSEAVVLNFAVVKAVNN